MDNPLLPDDKAAEEALQQRIALKATLARDAGEWFDIFEEVTTHHVVKTMEAHGDSPIDVLNDWKDDKIAVRRELVAHGLPLSEEIEIEGPVQDPSRPTDQTAILWPMGQQLTIHWPDGSKLEFRGRKALIAFSFIIWWDSFQSAYKIPNAPEKTRMIKPGSKEWDDYYRAKAFDRKRGVE